ncbi:FAD-dependent oxidoreductase [Craurococcus roseus]|uniref:FAD-dependent oxidoreductase n=1 Tax=Craurococcus roseus TaxID=77585 RepID=A0ABP3PRB6_9PROT
MPSSHVCPRYAYRRPAALDGPGRAEDARVVVVGGGVVGLTLALDLARRGVASVLLDEDDTVSVGSRAICWAKRTLEIYDRLGLGQRFLEKGVTWNTGRVFFRDAEAYSFDLLPEQGHAYPAFVNLQQYYVEEWLVEACAATGLVDLRWRNRAAAIENRPDGPLLTVETPDGAYSLRAGWLLACDGARSGIRQALGLPFVGQVFRDRFLIADVRMDLPYPAERRFWFDPPFHPGKTVLLHRQADGEWRMDFQLDADSDPEAERRPERVEARLRAMLGPDVPVGIGWASVYTFRCRRLERFRHGRTFFVGDSAHQVSPFGARGGNSGVQDADNLGWKLAAVLEGGAPEPLLDSYDAERGPAADENILHSSRSTDFITPKSGAALAYRDAVLELAETHALARPLVNSGRLSRPTVLAGSPLSTPDGGAPPAALPTGSPPVDAPVLRDGRPDWLLRHLNTGGRFTLLAFDETGLRAPPAPPGVDLVVVAEREAAPGHLPGVLVDHSGLAARRWGCVPGEALLLRPDGHVAAGFRAPTPEAVRSAHARALGNAVAAAAA